MVNSMYCIICNKHRDCRGDFLPDALGAAEFPSRTVCCENRSELIEWRAPLQMLRKWENPTDFVARHVATASRWKAVCRRNALSDCQERGVSFLPYCKVCKHSTDMAESQA